MAEGVRIFTDANWEEDVVRSSAPVLVDFWATWCAPCRTLEPTVEAMAAHFNGKLRVGKMNAEENADIPYRYNITTLPTLLVLKGGKVVEQRIGLISKEGLTKLLEPHLS